MVIGTMPAIGPILGGYLHELYGWQAGFLTVGGLASAALLSIGFFVPTTGGQSEGSIRLSAIVGNYVRLLAQAPFMACAAIGGVMFAGLYAFVTAAPFALIDARGVSPASYGLYQGLSVTGYLIGAATTGLLAYRTNAQGLLPFGLASGLSGGVLFLVLAESGILETTPELIVLAIGVFVFGLSIVVATTPILAFSFVGGSIKGTAAAVLSGIQVFGGGLGAHAVRSFDGTQFRTLAFALIGAALLATLAYGSLVRSAARSAE
ncbi:MAG: MFS transporter [Gammaproteobacteria bacterium]|nr:MFS transporter [Gammaproteobacteria bacterium]